MAVLNEHDKDVKFIKETGKIGWISRYDLDFDGLIFPLDIPAGPPH
jgi:hypothetical protein